VTSLDEKVDPVGACVGYRKSRIENIIKELSGEKIDIVQWSRDPQVFIARSLGPARVSEVIREGETWIVVVPDAEFSIAIGKKGQNVWLASLLCQVKIEVLKETDYRNRVIMSKAASVPLAKLGLDETLVPKLEAANLTNALDLLNSTPEEITRITELPAESVEAWKQQVRDAVWRSTADLSARLAELRAAQPQPITGARIT
jgi:N utilization substance protein A